MKFSVRFVPCLLLTAAIAVDAKRLGGPTLAAADVDGLRKLQIGGAVLPAAVEDPVDVGAVVVGNGIPVAGGNGGANASPPPPPALDLDAPAVAVPAAVGYYEEVVDPANTFPGDFYQDVDVAVGVVATGPAFPQDTYVNDGDYDNDNDNDYSYPPYGPNGGRPAFGGPSGTGGGDGYYQQEGLTAGVGAAVDYYEEEYFEPGQGQGGAAVDYYVEEYFEPGQGQGGAFPEDTYVNDGDYDYDNYYSYPPYGPNGGRPAFGGPPGGGNEYYQQEGLTAGVGAADYYEEEQGYYEQEGLTAGVGAAVEDVAVGVVPTGPAFPEDTYENNYYGEDEQGYYEDYEQNYDVGGDYDYEYEYDYGGNSQTVSGTSPNGGYYAGTTGTGPYGGYTYENVAAGRPSGGGGGGGSYQSSYITGPGGGYMGGATSTRPGGLTRPPYSGGGGAYSYGSQYGRPSSSASGGAYGSGYGSNTYTRPARSGGGRGYGGY